MRLATKVAWLCVWALSTPVPAVAADTSDGWFGAARLDYWGGQPYGVGAGMMDGQLADWKPEADREDLKNSTVAPAADRELNWSELLDPTSEAFWKEGEHVPPAQLMAVIRDPSAENVNRYRAWQRKKLEMSSWVAQLVAEPDVRPQVDWSRVTVVYFYAMGCGVCARNAPVVDELAALGADVMPVHLDRPSPRWPSSTPWSAEMSGLVNLQGTPTWVLVQGERRITVRGLASLERLEKELTE
jgi:thiol-disulfide isomerase/thioredoxin